MINCFIPFLSLPQARQTVRALGLCDRIKNIYLLATEKIPDEVEGCEMLMIDSPASTATFRTIALHADTAYTLLYTKYSSNSITNISLIEPGQFAFERLLAIAGDTNAGMLYADRYLLKNGNSQQAPVIDYQKGSLRDDFDFGSLLFFRSSVLKQAVRAMDADYRFAGAETDGSGGCAARGVLQLLQQRYVGHGFDLPPLRELLGAGRRGHGRFHSGIRRTETARKNVRIRFWVY